MRMVTYTVKPGEAERNAELIRAVLAEVPDGMRYEVYRDGDTFVHLALDGTPTELPAFARFTEHHAQRRASAVSISDFDRVGVV